VKVDRILIDIFDWVRRLVFSRKNRAISKPYERLESWRGSAGVLHKVRRDTPRAVDTYVFTPLRSGNSKAATPKDIHICLDHLDVLPGQRTRTRRTYTHRITVLLASHWPQEDGTYDTSLLYSASWDFQGRSQYRDRWAIAITYDVARLLKDRPFNRIDWEFEFTASAKQMMGSSFRYKTPDCA
jgi:hypothetical protein